MKERTKQKKEWVVDIYISRHGATEWEELAEHWYCQSSRASYTLRGMYPRTFHGVVRHMKLMIARTEASGLAVFCKDLTTSRLRNVVTGEIIPWAAMGA